MQLLALHGSELDFYHHPDKRYDTRVRWSRALDLYSLGVVLLEIGLWRPVEALVDCGDGEFERVRKGFLALTMQLDGCVFSFLGSYFVLVLLLFCYWVVPFCSFLFLFLEVSFPINETWLIV